MRPGHQRLHITRVSNSPPTCTIPRNSTGLFRCANSPSPVGFLCVLADIYKAQKPAQNPSPRDPASATQRGGTLLGGTFGPRGELPLPPELRTTDLLFC